MEQVTREQIIKAFADIMIENLNNKLTSALANGLLMALSNALQQAESAAGGDD